MSIVVKFLEHINVCSTYLGRYRLIRNAISLIQRRLEASHGGLSRVVALNPPKLCLNLSLHEDGEMNTSRLVISRRKAAESTRDRWAVKRMCIRKAITSWKRTSSVTTRRQTKRQMKRYEEPAILKPPIHSGRREKSYILYIQASSANNVLSITHTRTHTNNPAL